MSVSRSRFLTTFTALSAVVALVACGEGQSPVSPSSGELSVKPQVVPLVTTSANWEFAGIITPTPGTDPVDLGPSETFSLTNATGNHGSIVATAGTGAHVTLKGFALPVNDPERGLGICLTTGDPCTFPDDGDEVGDGGPGTLLLDFDGVLPVGSTLKEITLASLQADEGYRYSISTDGGSTFGAATDVYPNNPDDLATLSINLPTAMLVVKFEKAPDIPAAQPYDNDYNVSAVTTEFTTTELEGRMTGGGIKAVNTDEEPVTFGLTLHCDITLSNNLEVNWPGHKWHLAKPITSASCDNIQMDPEPPASPIDTFEGEGYGRLDGVGDSFVQFRFEDHGEPGSNDKVAITIYEPGTYTGPGTGTVAMEVELQNISVGNWQMHYDQPHGQKP